jgi:hypothetical protein
MFNVMLTNKPRIDFKALIQRGDQIEFEVRGG